MTFLGQFARGQSSNTCSTICTVKEVLMAANANYGVGSVLLYYMSNEPDTVSWSEDERIAVTANEIVYILVSVY